MGEIYTQEIKSNDPQFYLKNTVIESSNYLHDKMRDDKDRMYSKIYFAVSLVLTILASFFTKYLCLISILILMNLLIFLIIISAKNYNKQRKRFELNRKRMKKSFKDLSLEWRD